MRMALPFLAFLLCGCIPGELTPVTRLQDVAFMAIAKDPDPAFLRVLFTTRSDLVELAHAHDRSMDVMVWPCSAGWRPRTYLNDPHIHDDAGVIDRRRTGSTMGDSYYFRLSVRTQGSAGYTPPSPYDLATQAQDMCFRVGGGSSNLISEPTYMVASNAATVPAGAIRAALAP